MNKSVWVLQHVAFEDLGILKPILLERGFSIRIIEVGVEDFSILHPLEPDLLIVLGGPIGVYEQEDYPFLSGEIAWIQKRVAQNLPTLGICLGAQLIAAALGSRVYPGHIKELGWGELELTQEGQASFVKHLHAKYTSVLHWHGDVFDLPAGALSLAKTKNYPVQAFSYAMHRILGILFHPEVDPTQIERWLMGHTIEISKTPHTDVKTIRFDTHRYGHIAAKQGSLFFDEWLMQIEFT